MALLELPADGWQYSRRRETASRQLAQKGGKEGFWDLFQFLSSKVNTPKTCRVSWERIEGARQQEMRRGDAPRADQSWWAAQRQVRLMRVSISSQVPLRHNMACYWMWRTWSGPIQHLFYLVNEEQKEVRSNEEGTQGTHSQETLCWHYSLLLMRFW